MKYRCSFRRKNKQPNYKYSEKDLKNFFCVSKWWILTCKFHLPQRAPARPSSVTCQVNESPRVFSVSKSLGDDGKMHFHSNSIRGRWCWTTAGPVSVDSCHASVRINKIKFSLWFFYQIITAMNKALCYFPSRLIYHFSNIYGLGTPFSDITTNPLADLQVCHQAHYSLCFTKYKPCRSPA